MVLPATDVASGRYSVLAEPSSIRRWVSRTIGTYTAPAIAALAVLTPRGAPPMLATAQTSGLLTIWAISGGAGRVLCQVEVLPQSAGTEPTGELHVTGLCAPLRTHACSHSVGFCARAPYITRSIQASFAMQGRVCVARRARRRAAA